MTDRFFAAAALANEVHGEHRRLGTRVPYAADLMIVAGVVLEDGGGRPMLERIRTEFGDDVAAIVEACSDSLDPDDPRSWRERKADYLAHLPDVTDEATLRMALADKVHNARSIVRDYRSEGHALRERFTNKTIDDPGPLVEDLRSALAELERLAAEDPQMSEAPRAIT